MQVSEPDLAVTDMAFKVNFWKHGEGHWCYLFCIPTCSKDTLAFTLLQGSLTSALLKGSWAHGLRSVGVRQGSSKIIRNVFNPKDVTNMIQDITTQMSQNPPSLTSQPRKNPAVHTQMAANTSLRTNASARTHTCKHASTQPSLAMLLPSNAMNEVISRVLPFAMKSARIR